MEPMKKSGLFFFLILTVLLCGTEVYSQSQKGRDGRYRDKRVSINRFSLLNSGTHGVFDKLTFVSSGYSELKQSPGDVYILINEEGQNIQFVGQADKTRSTIIWGGIFPFVTLPSGDIENEEGFISDHSVSFFWYFKKKF